MTTNMKIVSINAAKKERLKGPKGSMETGIFKMPLPGSAKITSLGVQGDAIVNKAVHGGEDQALYIYSEEDYALWSSELAKKLAPGIFGENLTVSGLDVSALVIGDKLEIADVVLEITAPRTPCLKLAARMEDSGFAKKFVKAGRPGAYARVLNEGTINIDDKITLTKTNLDYASIMEVFTEWHAKNRSLTVLEKALNSPISIHHKIKIQQWYDDKSQL